MTTGQLPGRTPTCRPELVTVNGRPDRLYRHQAEGLYVWGRSRRALRPVIDPPDDDDEEAGR